MLQLTQKPLATLASIIGLSLLTACDSDNDNSSTQLAYSTAVIQTIDGGYASSQVAFVDIDNKTIDDGYYVQAKSDYTVDTDGENIYHIGKYFIDTITKYSADDVNNQQWSYSTNDDNSSGSNNAYTLVPYTKNKAYLIQYGAKKVWVVNPEATTPESFKIDELDLSSYLPENNANTPTASDGIIINDKLFVVMQRLGADWSENTAYVAVFDAKTGEEIETNADATDTVKGIPLAGTNPWQNSLASLDNTLYVTEKTNIEAINANTFATSLIADATDIIGTSGARLTVSEFISAEQAYVVLSSYDENWNANDNVYAFNPTTGEINDTSVTNYQTTGIPFIVKDNDNNLWVSAANANNPGIDIYQTSDNTLLINRISTELNPQKIVFLNER